MRPKYKIPAFTLVEVLVVLAVTGIVIALAFTVLSLITKQFITMRTRYEQRTEVTKFKQRLLFDFEKGTDVLWSERQQQLAITIKDEIVTYEFASDYVLRGRDTIPFTIENTLFYYKGEEIEEGVTDGLEVNMTIKGNAVGFFISREVDTQKSIQEVWE